MLFQFFFVRGGSGKQFGNPALMHLGHFLKPPLAVLGEQDPLSAAVRWSAVQFHPALCGQTLDHSGDVAVGNEQVFGQLRHRHRATGAVERSQQIELGQGDAEVGAQSLSQVILDARRAAQHPQPEAQPFFRNGIRNACFSHAVVGFRSFW